MVKPNKVMIARRRPLPSTCDATNVCWWRNPPQIDRHPNRQPPRNVPAAFSTNSAQQTAITSAWRSAKSRKGVYYTHKKNEVAFGHFSSCWWSILRPPADGPLRPRSRLKRQSIAAQESEQLRYSKFAFKYPCYWRVLANYGTIICELTCSV